MKLDKFQKIERKDLIEYFGKNLSIYHFDRVTIVIVKTGPNRGKIAWSIHSLDDGKNHRKYGEWVALFRLYEGGMPIELDYYMPEDVGDYMWNLACDFANRITE